VAFDGKLSFARPASGDGKLVLGDTGGGGGPVAPPVRIGIDATFGDDGPANLTLRVARRVGIDATFGDEDETPADVRLLWDANVSRGSRIPLQSHWQEAQPVQRALRTHWQESAPLRLALIARWQDAERAHHALRAHWQETERLRASVRSHWQDADPLRASLLARWQEAERHRASLRSHWQDGDPMRSALRQHWQETLRLRAAIRTHWQDANAIRAALRFHFTDGQRTRLALRSHWQEAMRPPAGRYIPPPIHQPKPPPCYDPERLGLLVFERPFSGDGKLIFICQRPGDVLPPATIVIPPRRTYIVINTIEIRRADSAELLPSEAFSMTLDRDSWTWSFSATLHREARDAVAPGPDGAPVELEVKINGQPFRLQAERIARSVRFPERQIKVSGRGKAALLDAPHAAVQSFGNDMPRTAYQLMVDVLTINGVGIGWTVDWQLTDWLVPGGAWLHQGTWISALNDIAASAGGYLQPHDTAPILRVLPAWPRPWWEWASVAPDLELPAGIAEVEDTEWVDKPLYDRIFVSGQATGGVLGDYKRAGTAGEVLRPMVVHPLITDDAAVRQRAVAELSDSGRLVNQTLTLQVLPATGVIKPGTLLRYTDDDGAPRLGIVRSTAINWDFPVLTQTIGVEGHA
jgi:hypothetical protein